MSTRSTRTKASRRSRESSAATTHPRSPARWPAVAAATALCSSSCCRSWLRSFWPISESSSAKRASRPRKRRPPDARAHTNRADSSGPAAHNVPAAVGGASGGEHAVRVPAHRRKRMQGYEVLWQPGMDHAGIATQSVVENQLAVDGKTKEDFGRELFIDKVWDWKRESGGAIGG